MNSIGGILLAAGSASRFGAPKQAARVGEQTLLQRSVQQLSTAGVAAWVVVLGAHLERVDALLPADAPRVVNPEWADGMLGSLQTGLRFLLAQTAGLDGIFVMAGDQPDFTADRIERYLQTARTEHGIRSVVTDYVGSGNGLPFVLPQSLFERILALPRSGRLRPLLQSLVEVEVLAGGPHLRDIDTREDLADWWRTRG